MRLSTLFRTADINTLAAEAQEDAGILLLDVRTPEEFREGHIPGSVSLPLGQIRRFPQMCPDKDQDVYVYCHSGARSGQACRELEQMGYTRVQNIGGITAWRGPVRTGNGPA